MQDGTQGVIFINNHEDRHREHANNNQKTKNKCEIIV